MSRWSLALVIGLLFALGIGVVKYLEESNVVGATKVNGTILDAQPSLTGIVVTVLANGEIYKIYTNATMLNISKPLTIHFDDGKIVAVEQDGKVFGVVMYIGLKNLEKMPEVRNT